MPTLACPRCSDRLTARPEGGLGAHLCPTCGGVFIDHALARQIDASTVAGALHRLATDAARRAPFGGSLGLDRIACPVCRIPMEQRQHGRVQITVDVCSSHGVWFDRGELQRVTERITSSPYRTSGASVQAAQPRPAVLELPPLDPHYVLPEPIPPPPPTTGSPLLDIIAQLLSD